MRFNKSKVYTAANADEVKIGSKGYFANNIANLKDKVELSNLSLFEVTEILDESDKFRFKSEVTGELFNLFYLVEEPEEKTFRPYKDTDEMIEDFKKRFDTNCPPYGFPLIWVKDKCTEIKKKSLVTIFIDDFGNDYIRFDGAFHLVSTLLDKYTYLDGSPCGIEE